MIKTKKVRRIPKESEILNLLAQIRFAWASESYRPSFPASGLPLDSLSLLYFSLSTTIHGEREAFIKPRTFWQTQAMFRHNHPLFGILLPKFVLEARGRLGSGSQLIRPQPGPFALRFHLRPDAGPLVICRWLTLRLRDKYFRMRDKNCLLLKLFFYL